ncbi:MAG: peptidase domain-containing ABC transporter [Planctomycetaceae bacterium]|nr:peptidase domain-containing ABC transporter [Planctomycetaceae bacterium]
MFRKFHCVRQTDGSDCGAASLATVARHYGVKFGLENIRDLAGTDRIGTNLLGLVAGAERMGLTAKAVSGPYDALIRIQFPAIAHLKTADGYGHFVVLHKASAKGVVLADPARGIVRMSRDEFENTWTGYLLLLAPNETFAATARQSAGSPVAPSRRFFHLLAAHRSILVEAVLCAVLMTILGLSTSYFVQHLVDSVLVRGETRLLNALGIGMGAVLVFRMLFGVLRQYLLAYVGRKIDLSLIAGYTRHVLSLPMNFFEMRQVGEILSRANDASKVRSAISGAALTAAVDGVVVVFTAVILCCYDVQLAAIAALFGPVWFLVVLMHHPAAKRLSREGMEANAKLSAHVVEDISGVETIKAFGAQRSRMEAGESRLVKLVQTAFSMQMLGTSLGALGELLTGAAGLAILWYGGHRVVSGALTIGELMFFYTLLGYLLDPLQRLATVNIQFQEAFIAVDRLFQVLDIQPEALDDRKATFTGVKDAIELRDVNFRYGCRRNVLNGLNLRIPAGATVAIVGESGCGKSTLLKMLMRFHDPNEGRIAVDGVDLRDFNLASLREQIGIVSQEPFIINGTLRDNIALGKPEADLNEVIAAARAAGLEDFINQLPERYETMLGERGANLSGGERQRLAIARAILKQPALLIFDEATSHLDTRTERAIQESLRSVFADRTVLLVAHRLSTVRDADLIYVMHEGQVVEQGSHHELLAQGGRYAQLWKSQGAENTVTTDSRRPMRAGNEGRRLAAV